MASTAFQTVIRSDWISASASRGSKPSVRTSVAPCVRVMSGMTSPPQVPEKGSVWRTRSSAVSRNRSPDAQPCGRQLRWLIIAPLGNDVVPEV